MIKSKYRKNILLIFTSLIFALLFCFSIVPFSTFAETGSNTADTSAEPFEIGTDLLFEAKDRTGSPLAIAKNTIEYNDSKAYIVNWSDIKSFSLKYKPNKENKPDIAYEEGKEEIPENIIYKSSIDIEYLKGYAPDANFNTLAKLKFDNVLTEKAGGMNGYLSLSKKFNFDVDNGITMIKDNKSKEKEVINGWGIYRFTLRINQKTHAISSFLYIKPTIEIDEQPIIGYTTYGSDIGTYEAFKFKLNNEFLYRYIDESKLIWYVKGKGRDGTEYYLTPEDSARFPDRNHAIFPGDIDRYGTEFKFDNAIAGEWTVWCEYQAYNSPELLKSDIEITVKTGNSIDAMVIVWIGVGVLSATTIAVIVFAVLKKKKEKVW